MVKQYSLYIFFSLFILLDVGYSFFQYYNEPLDGDMANIILPAPSYGQVLNDPFGWIALTEHKKCAGPNRYFAHQLMSSYFRNVPLMLQNFLSPIDSVYVSCALLKIIIHLLLLGILIAYSNFFFRSKKINCLIAAVLLVPLFQTAGYNRSFGIIGHSITYTVFYALPIGLLLLFFWPFWKKVQLPEYRISNGQIIFSMILMLILSFNGPLVTPLVMIICPSVLLMLFYKSFKESKNHSFSQRLSFSIFQIPKRVMIPFLLFTLLSCYSFYIGTFNAESSKGIPLVNRYLVIPQGIYFQFTRKIGFALLSLFIVVNTILMRKHRRNSIARILLRHYRWVGVFCFVYILLLPLGGYREYRPNVLRMDTIIPINICLFYYFTSSTLFLFLHFRSRQKTVFSLAIALLLFIFTIADEPNFDKNKCERKAFQQLKGSTSYVNKVDSDCTVMGWVTPIYKENAIRNGKILYLWGITSEPKWYYQK